MTMSSFTLQAQTRADKGKGASRRLRRLNNEVPAILYGDDKAPAMLSVPHKDLAKCLESEAFYSSIITLTVDGQAQKVLLRDLQRHPAAPRILHADFQRVSGTKKIHMRVPLHFINEDICAGVKQQGGAINHSMNELEVSCLAADLPEFIEVDLAAVVVDQIVHISDLKLPKGVESVALSHGADHDLPVVAVHAIKGGSSEE
ncbi:MAG: 50S ribosomal protein L25/general stress protein Ctc [Cellvibrionales bacterium]|nr:50S ribosomal protein L25/general stress protein Ctc [Cellvibrionales bacterium]